MKKKRFGNCETCKWRTGTRCNKNKEYINLADWCASWSKVKEGK
jgi:hypothetical protein